MAEPTGRGVDGRGRRAGPGRLLVPVAGVFRRLRAWRWRRRARRYRAATGSYRIPVQVCPRGCSHQLARQDFVTRTRLGGQAEVRVHAHFETQSCPVCGTVFTRTCGRCGQEILAPVADRCENCGLPHPWSTERRETVVRARQRPWRAGPGHQALAERVVPTGDAGGLYVVEGDVTTFSVDAVISNDDTDGRMWSSVASAIKAAAGAEVERESVAGGPYRLGSAWSTSAGTLDMKRIVHVAAMDRQGNRGTLETLGQCVRSALADADEQELDSIALATMGAWGRSISSPGAGATAITLREWLTAVVPLVVGHLRARRPDLAVLLVLYEPTDLEHVRAAVPASR